MNVKKHQADKSILSNQEKRSLEVRKYFNHCTSCGLWLSNEEMNENLICKNCQEIVPLPED